MSESRKEWKKRPLLERLRDYAYMADDHVAVDAAERIAELERENAELREQLKNAAMAVLDNTIGKL